MDDEFVMVFPVSKLYELGYFQGFSTLSQKYLCHILAESFFIERSVAEVDTSLKQLIPHSILRYNDSLFSYRRARRGREGRLHKLYSIGIGGHINPEDPSKARQTRQ